MTTEQAAIIAALEEEHGTQPVYAILGQIVAPNIGGLDFARWVARAQRELS